MEHRADMPSDYAKAVARRAARLAKSEDVDWRNLDADGRREFKSRVRENDKVADRQG